MALTLDSSKLYEITKTFIDAKVSYGYGKKADIHDEPSKIKSIDCSGFVQYVVYHASNKQFIFHGGSVTQREKCDSLKLEKVDYSTCDQNDGWLRIAFIKKSKKMAIGHVWLIHSGRTLESHGGYGPDQRAWDTEKLKNNVYACYKLSQLFTQSEATN